MRSLRRPVVTAVLAASVVLAGCSSDGGEQSTAALERQVEAQDRVQTALRQRIEELEAQVETLLVADGGSEAEQLTDLDERMATLESGLESLATRIDEVVANQTGNQEAVDELRSQLTGLQSTVGELSDQLTLVQEDLEALRRRLETHQHN